MMKKFYLVILLLAISSRLYAKGVMMARVLYKSSSERTLAIDVGDLDDFKEGDVGNILIQRGTYERPVLFLIGKGRIVKSFPNKSVWLMSKQYIKDKILPNEPVLLLTDRQVSSGRPTKLRQKQIIFSEKDYDSVEDFVENNQNAIPEKFIAYSDQFEASDDVFNEDKIAEIDKEFTTYDKFRNHGTVRVADEYSDEIKSLTYYLNDKYLIGDLKKAEDVALLDNDTNALIDKYNRQKYKLSNGLYREQRKNPVIRDLTDKLSITSMHDDRKIEDQKKEEVSKAATAKIKRDGELWSADMDDDTLRRYFIATGLEREKERREVSMNELDGHEVLISFGSNTSTHVTSADVDPNFQMLGYHINLAYELHFSRTALRNKDWSMQFLLEQAINYYNLNNINGRSAEGLYGAYLNYYFINNPLTLHRFIWSMGLGMKFGMSRMTSDQLSQAYDYQVLTLPSIQLMTKYRFRSGDLSDENVNVGISANAGVIIETKNLRIVNNPSDNIDSKITASDVKYTLGLSFYF